MKTFRMLAACALIGCLAALPQARADDDSFEVDFVNDASFRVTVYMNGDAVCTLDAGESCDKDFDSSGGTYAVHFVAGTGSTSDDTVSATSCDDSYVPTFTIQDEHVHFSCEDALF